MGDADKQYFDGAKTYKVTLPKGIPEANFWSFTLYDNQTRSMLDTPQRYPRADSQSYPSPAAEAAADGSATLWFAPIQPKGRRALQLDPDHARQGIFRAPAPLQPASHSSQRNCGRARSNWFAKARILELNKAQFTNGTLRQSCSTRVCFPLPQQQTKAQVTLFFFWRISATAASHALPLHPLLKCLIRCGRDSLMRTDDRVDALQGERRAAK